jgi:Condensation domain
VTEAARSTLVDALAGHPARRVSFAAPAAPRSGPLTWAQRHMLMLVEALGPQSQSVNIRSSLRLRAGLGEKEVLDALRDLVETFEALRSVYRPGVDGPEQQVLARGELVVPVVDAEARGSAAAAEEVAAALWEAPFDIAGEWPLRVALVTVGGVPRHLPMTVCHLFVDHTAGIWIQHHLRAVLAHPPAAVRPPRERHEPLDEAAWEASVAGRQHGERAVAEHAEALRAMPQTMLPRAAGEPDRPRYRFLQFDSPALGLAVATLAARHNVSPAAVLHAGICAVAGHAAGLDRAFLQLTVGNRIAARSRFAVGMYTQDVPVHIDLAGAGMADVIRRSGAAVVRAARFGQYPPVELAARRRQIELDRGVAFDLSCWLNYRTLGTRRPSGVDRPDPARLAELAGRTRWRWTDTVDSSTSTYFVFADDAGDVLRLTLLLDSAVLPADEGVAWLRAVERLLCATVTTEVGVPEIGEHTGLAPAPRGPEWTLLAPGWAHRPTVAELVRRVAGVRRVDVFTDPAGDGRRLVACLDGGDSTVDITRLHAAVVDALPGVRTAVAPHRYVVCAGAPDRAELGAWHRLPIRSEGTGRAERAPLPAGR